MKLITVIGVLFLLNVPFVNGQIIPLLHQRTITFELLEDNKQLFWIDYYEGLLMPCDTATFTVNPLPYIGILGKRWNLHSKYYISEGMINLIPEGQDLKNWREMITVERVDAPGISSKTLYNIFMESDEKKCPGKNYYTRITDDSDNTVTYEVKSNKCKKAEAQSEITKILAPLVPDPNQQYTMWIIRYAKKNSDFNDAQRTSIHDWFGAIKLLTGMEMEAFVKQHKDVKENNEK